MLEEMETSSVRHQIHLPLGCGIISDNTLMTKIMSGADVCDEAELVGCSATNYRPE